MPPIPASNRFNVEANRPSAPIDFAAVGAPTTMTYHGLSIQVGNVTIGRITEWQPPALDREFNHIFELNAKTWGQPVDGVPGRASSSFELGLTRAEVWNEELEKAFGESDVYTLLINQTRPFQIDEVYTKGTAIYRRFRYLGCWFTSRTFDAMSAEGDAIVRVSGNLMYVNRVRIT